MKPRQVIYLAILFAFAAICSSQGSVGGGINWIIDSVHNLFSNVHWDNTNG